MTISNTPAYQLHTTGLPKPSVPSDYNRYFFDPTPALTQPRIVGLLACQRDPYLRNLTSEITASRKFVAPQLAKIKGKDKKSGKNAVDGEGNNQNQITIPGELWEVEFVDTVLFPEGGGQPNDTGTLILPSSPPLKVENVQRTGLRAVHHVRVPPELVHSAEEILKKGVKVEMEVDWERRYDQMSMHTGQHLVSAICDNTLSLPTLSWSMPPHPSTEPCYIEIPRGLTPTEALAIEEAANEMVMTRGHRSVDDHGIKVWIESRIQAPSGTVTPAEKVIGTSNDIEERRGQGMGETDEEKREGEWGDRESRGLPKDYEDGVVRTAVIEGVDRSLCCGTHHPSLTCLQLIHIIPPSSSTPSSKPTRLYLLAGPRALRHLLAASKSISACAAIVGCSRPEVPVRVEQRQTQAREAERVGGKIRSELGKLLGTNVAWKEVDGVWKGSVERTDDATHDADFLGTISNAATTALLADKPNANYVFVTSSLLSSNMVHPDVETTLVQIVSNPPELAKETGEKFKSALENGRVKGGGAKGRWQGRISGKWGKGEWGVVKSLVE